MVEKEKKQREEEESKEEVSAGNTANQVSANRSDEKEQEEKSPPSADDLDPSRTPPKPEGDEEDFAAMMADYEDTLKDLEEGEIVKGVIVAVTEDEVLVDVGYKSEGSININEFPDPSALEVGQEVEVYLDKKEDQDGVVVLSKEKADFFGKWEQIKDYYENDQVITGKILDVVKGGLAVDIGVRAFLPASQVSLRPTKDLEQHIGKSMDFKVVKLNKRRRNIVLSHKVILAEAREEMKKKLVETLKEGQVVEGEVKNITDFGAFVDIGGLDGLLHLTDLSWGRINHPSIGSPFHGQHSNIYTGHSHDGYFRSTLLDSLRIRSRNTDNRCLWFKNQL